MPVQDGFSIYCHIWVVSFSLPPFVLLHMYVKYLIISKKPVKHSTVVLECSRSNSEFPERTERSPAGQSVPPVLFLPLLKSTQKMQPSHANISVRAHSQVSK